MAGTPELVIPIRLDPGKAAAALRALGTAGQQAGDAVATSAAKADKAVADVGSSAVSAVKAMGGMTAAAAVFSTINERAKETSDYVHRLAADFVALQKTMQAVSAIMGQRNNNELVVAEAKLGAQANRTPEQWASFRQAFMAKASGFVGNAKPGEPERILNDAEATKLQLSMAEFAGVKGIKDQEMADLVGGVIAQEKAPTTAEELQKRIGKAYAELEQSSTEPQLLVKGLTMGMAQGMSLEEVAPKMAMMPQIAPGEEGTYLRSTIAHLKKARREGKLEEFGVTDQMNANEMLETVVKYADKEAGTGPLRDKNMDVLLGKITNFQETTHTLASMANKGPAEMQRWKDIGLNTPDNAVEQAIAADRATNAGKQRASEAAAGAAAIAEGAEWTETERAKLDARTRLRDQKRFQQRTWGDVARGISGGISIPGTGISVGTGIGIEDQIVNEETIRGLKQQARGMGISPTEVSPGAGTFTGGATGEKGLRYQIDYDKEIKRLLQIIADNSKPNLSAPPASPAQANRP